MYQVSSNVLYIIQSMYKMSSVTIVLLTNETIKCELIPGQNEIKTLSTIYSIHIIRHRCINSPKP